MLEAVLASMAAHNCTYTITVIQQPVRARMCGFGDKDRRPISPPLVVQLRAVDRKTGREIPVDDIDTTFLVLAADLRSSDGSKDANRLRQPNAPIRATFGTASASPSTSSQHSRSHSPSSSAFGYLSPPSSQTSPMSTYAPPTGEGGVSSGLTLAASPPLGSQGSAHSPAAAAAPTGTVKRPLSTDAPPASLDMPTSSAEPPAKRRARSDSGAAAPSSSGFIPYARSRHTANELLTPSPALLAAAALAVDEEERAGDAGQGGGGGGDDREEEDAGPGEVPNLIGTLHTNAHKLKGLDGEKGVFFVLPDLSVRTEGAFRIRVRLLNIGVGMARTEARMPVVAQADTDEFKVSSAKKFEGMLDPTPLSQCLAKQGMRIPTRKVAKMRAPKGAAPAAGADEVKEEVA